MAEYSLSDSIDKDRIFIVKRSELDSRLEPKFYTQKYIDNENRLKSSKYTICHLLEVTDKISDGTHFTPNYKDEGIKFISVKDVRKSSINLNDTKFISEEEADKLDKRCKPQLNDVLLTKIGATFGFAATVETTERFQIFVSLALLRPNSKIIPQFLEIFLNTNLAYIQYDRVIKGAGVPDLHLEDIRKVKISLPPKKIQQEIVNRYHEALNNKQQKEKQARDLLNGIDDYLLKALGITLPQRKSDLQSRIFTTSFSEVTGIRFDSEYSQVFYREIRKSVEKCRYTTQILSKNLLFIESGSRPSGGVGNIESGVFSIGGEHVNDKCEVGIGTPKYIPQKFHEKIKNTETQIEDIILVKDGATTGKIGIIDNPEFVKQNINEHVFLLRPDKSVLNPYYLTYFLRSFIGQTLLKREITGATVTGLTKPVVKKIPIPIPEVTIQDKIANHIQELRRNSKEIEISAAHSFEKTKEEIEKLILG